jgi:hypothetical protein
MASKPVPKSSIVPGSGVAERFVSSKVKFVAVLSQVAVAVPPAIELELRENGSAYPEAEVVPSGKELVKYEVLCPGTELTIRSSLVPPSPQNRQAYLETFAASKI